jgi:hypothetical protein
MGCLTVLTRLVTQAILARLATAIVDSLFGGKLSQVVKRVLDWVLNRLPR